MDERVINKKVPLNVYQRIENLRLLINAAMAIGCHIVNITPQVILYGKFHLILGMVWQIMRIYLLKEINFKQVPEIIVLVEANEKLEDIIKLPSEKILIRWINYHMKNAKQPIVIKDLGIEPEKCDTKGLAETDLVKRADIVVENSLKIGVKKFVRGAGLAQGNNKLNLVFCSLLFSTNHGLYLSVEKKKEVEKAALLDEAKGVSK